MVKCWLHLDVHDAGPGHPHGCVLDHHELPVLLCARAVEVRDELLKLCQTWVGGFSDRSVELDLSFPPGPCLQCEFQRFTKCVNPFRFCLFREVY